MLYFNYEKSIEVLDPQTLQPTKGYAVGDVTPGSPIVHCLQIVGCGNTNTVTRATPSGYAGAGTEGTINGFR